jgi:micrococcal nuclease
MNIRILYVGMFLFLVFIVPSLCHAWSGKVVYVVDGYTIDVERNGKSVRVRLYGVDTPELDQGYGQNATIFTSSQVRGKMVEVQETGEAGWERAEGIVMVGNLNINRHLVEYGYAWVDLRYCKKQFCDDWTELEAEAKADKKGLWKNPNSMPPWEFRWARDKEN